MAKRPAKRADTLQDWARIIVTNPPKDDAGIDPAFKAAKPENGTAQLVMSLAVADRLVHDDTHSEPLIGSQLRDFAKRRLMRKFLPHGPGTVNLYNHAYTLRDAHLPID